MNFRHRQTVRQTDTDIDVYVTSRAKNHIINFTRCSVHVAHGHNSVPMAVVWSLPQS